MDRNKKNSGNFFSHEDDYRGIAESLVRQAIKRGADEAETYLEWGRTSEIRVRMRETDAIKRSDYKGLGLRFFKNGRLGFVSTNDFSDEALNLLLNHAQSHAGICGEDRFLGLPDPVKIEEHDLNIFDDTCLSMSAEEKVRLALEMEEAAFTVDALISNSEGAVFQDACKGSVIVNSNGISESYAKTAYSMHCAPVVENNDERRYGYWYSSGTHFSALEDNISIGKKAGERTVRMLGARKIGTQKVPVVFDSLAASGFIGTVMDCANGEARYKKETCFWDKRDTQVASELVTIRDYGNLNGGVGSLPFDGEGIPPVKKTVIEQGRLTSFLYDSYAARKDETVSTGNGLRTYATLPTIQGTNFFFENGRKTPQEVIKSVSKGLYVTGLIGFGVNIVNGDYSRGAEGLWIENGELTHPVHEVTVSGNILDMLMGIEDAADDLRLLSTASAPTLLIREMVVGGL
ncbi:TldD/PmbA family protein [candidate division KSB1 bacterium]